MKGGQRGILRQLHTQGDLDVDYGNSYFPVKSATL